MPGSAPQLTILLVEDDAAARGALEAVLRSWGHFCVSAATGEQGLALLAAQAWCCDAVISDFNLPGSHNGLRLIEAVRESTRPDLPAVLVSGTLDPALRNEATRAHCIALVKPVKPLQLRSVLAQIGASRATPAAENLASG